LLTRKGAYVARWFNAHPVLHSVGFALDPEYQSRGGREDWKVTGSVHNVGTFRSGYFLRRICQGVRSTHDCLSVVGELGGTLPEFRELTMRVLAPSVSWVLVRERGSGPL